jgi:hypothetical protein
MGTDRCRYRRSLSFLRTGLRVEAMLRPKVLSFCGQILLGRGAWHQSAHHQDTRDVTDLHVLSPGSYECDWLSNARLSRRDTQAFARHSWRSAAIRRSCALSAAVGLAHSGSMLRFYILSGPEPGGPGVTCPYCRLHGSRYERRGTLRARRRDSSRRCRAPRPGLARAMRSQL